MCELILPGKAADNLRQSWEGHIMKALPVWTDTFAGAEVLSTTTVFSPFLLIATTSDACKGWDHCSEGAAMPSEASSTRTEDSPALRVHCPPFRACLRDSRGALATGAMGHRPWIR